MSTKKLSNMTDEELHAEAAIATEAKLAAKARENEINAELEIRTAMAAMSPATRRIVALSLNGKIAPEGEPVTEGAPA